MIYRIIILITCLFLTACSGHIMGKVYVDDNNNGILDDSEAGVPYAKLSILFDTDRVAAGLTNKDGDFRARVRKNGKYCINLDSRTLRSAVSNISAAKGMDLDLSGKAQTTANFAPPQDTQNQTETTNPRCTDEDNDGRCDASCTDANDDGECDDNCIDEDYDGFCDNKKKQKEAPPPGWTKSGFCFSRDKFDAEINIPVRIDYESANPSASSLPPAECRAGATCEISIAVPRGCALKPLTLPDGLSAVGAPNRTSSLHSNATLESSGDSDRTLTDDDSDEDEIASPVVTPETAIMTQNLSAAEDIPAGETTVTISPSADCGAEDLSLAPVSVKLVRTVSASVTINLVGAPGAGHDTTVKVYVENTGDGTINAGEMSVDIPSGTTITRVSNGCRNLGNKMACDTGLIAAGAKMQAQVTFRIPASPGANAVFTVNATFASDELEEDATAEPVEFSISE